MALDRQSIEKKDFPIGRRGYDPEAVDAHLQALADEVDALKRASRRRTDTLASAASEQVRAIVQAAETSASEIQRQAEDDARDIRDEASADAERTREHASAQGREYVDRISEAATVMLQRVDAMDGELGTLVDGLRTGANRLTADLSLLQQNMGELATSAGARAPRPEIEAPPARQAPPPPPPRRVEPEPYREPEPYPEPAYGEPATAALDAGVDDVDELEPEDEAAFESRARPAGGEADTEGARLVALNMALNGTPRGETDRYLAENFDLVDRATLLDEVYASVE